MANTVTPRTLADVTREAEALIEQQQFQKALELLHEGRSLSGTASEDGAMQYTLGLTLLGLKRGSEAASAFRRAAELFDANEWEKRGLCFEQAAGAYYARRSFREAIEQYRIAANLYHGHEAKALMGRAVRSIGNVQVDMGDKVAALASFREARQLHLQAGDQEGLAMAVMNLASLVFEKEGRTGAIREYRQCVEQDGCAHHLALNNLGFLLTLDGQLEAAVSTLEKADQDLQARGVNDEDGGLLNLNLGNVYLLQGQADAADKRLQQALTHFRNEGPGRAIELVVLANEKVRADGFDAFCLTDDGIKEAVARLTLAAAHVSRGKLDLALEEATTAVALDPQMAYVYAALGWVHLARQESEAATAAFRRAVGKEPNNAMLRKALDLVNPFASTRVGRNDACPCGSGKKFKKCHGAG